MSQKWDHPPLHFPIRDRGQPRAVGCAGPILRWIALISICVVVAVGCAVLCCRSATASLLILLLIVGAIYFAPTINAVQRGHSNAAAIAFVNVIFVWALIGYLVALVCSCAAPEREPRFSRPTSPWPLYRDKGQPKSSRMNNRQNAGADRLGQSRLGVDNGGQIDVG
jgi:hypothetical protein